MTPPHKGSHPTWFSLTPHGLGLGVKDHNGDGVGDVTGDGGWHAWRGEVGMSPAGNGAMRAMHGVDGMHGGSCPLGPPHAWGGFKL